MRMQTLRKLVSMISWVCILTQGALGQAIVKPATEPPARVYRAGKNPDPVLARAVATELGKGEHIVARLHTGETYRGHIVAIDESHFSIRLDQNKGILPISYADVVYLEQNLTKAAKILIGIGVGVGAVLAALYIWGEVCCE